jgi:hypothetical protein
MKVLEDEDLKLAIAKDGCIVYRSRGEGIKPLLEAIDTLGFDNLKGSILGDRVVGLAIGYIAAYAEFLEVHGLIVSRPAASFLESKGVTVYWAELVDTILDQSRSSPCPFEKLALEIGDFKEFYLAVKDKLRLSYHTI